MDSLQLNQPNAPIQTSVPLHSKQQELLKSTLEALGSMYETPNISQQDRHLADIFLQDFVRQADSLPVSEAILTHHNLPQSFYFFAANTLVIRVRGNAGDLHTAELRVQFRTRLFSYLQSFHFTPTQISTSFQTQPSAPVVERLASALGIMMIQFLSHNEWVDALQNVSMTLLGENLFNNLNTQLVLHWYDPQFLSQLSILLRILITIPETLGDHRLKLVGNKAHVVQALDTFRPWLLNFLSILLYASRPINWATDLQRKLTLSHGKFGITEANYQAFAQTYQGLLALPHPTRQLYKTIALNVIQIIHNWSENRIITFQHTLSYIITSSIDPNATLGNLFQSPLPVDPMETFSTQYLSSLSTVVNTHSLYSLLLQALNVPDLLQITTLTLSSLFLRQPAYDVLVDHFLFDDANDTRDDCDGYDSTNGGGGMQSQYDKNGMDGGIDTRLSDRVTFISEHSRHNAADKPQWLYGLVLKSIECFSTVFRQVYIDEWFEPQAISLVSMFADFISLFIPFMINDPNFDQENDLFTLLLNSLITILELTLLPTTPIILQQNIDNLLNSTTVAPNRPHSTLPSLPQVHMERLHSMGTLFSVLYYFEGQGDITPEVQIFPYQIMTNRRKLIGPVFTFIDHLTYSITTTQDNLYFDEDKTWAELNKHQNLGDFCDHDVTRHLNDRLDTISAAITLLTNRLPFFNTLIYRLIHVAFSAAQHPSKECLQDDSLVEGEVARYRNEVIDCVIGIFDLLGNQRSLQLWFSLFEQFQPLYNAYTQVYSPRAPDHPNNARLSNLSPEALVNLTQQGMGYFKAYNGSSLEQIVSDPNIAQQPQHDLNNFSPQIMLWDPRNGPDGWQPLEQLLWALGLIADFIHKAFTNNFRLHNYWKDQSAEFFSDHQGVAAHVTRTRVNRFSTGRRYRSTVFHVLQYGKLQHPDSPYGDGFSERNINDEMDMLTFLEQLAIFFDIFINDLHRNMNTLLCVQSLSIVQHYSPFLTLPFCISSATGRVLDNQTGQMVMKNPPRFQTNSQILRLLVQIQTSFCLYPCGVVSNVPVGLKKTNLPIVETIFEVKRPNALAGVESSSNQNGTSTIDGLFIPSFALKSFYQLVSNTQYVLVEDYGDEFITFLTFLLKRIVYAMCVGDPQGFFQLVAKNTLIDENTVLSYSSRFHAWSNVSLSRAISKIISLVSNEQQYHTLLHASVFSIFTMVDDSYQFYLKWVESSSKHLQQIAPPAPQGTQGTTQQQQQQQQQGVSMQQYTLWKKFFHTISWNIETTLTSLLQSIRALFISTELRPIDLLYANSHPNADTPWDNPQVKFYQLMVSAVGDSLPFFQRIVHTFTIQHYTIPHSSTEIIGQLIPQHIVVDKIASIWSVVMSTASHFAVPLYSQICQIACQAFQTTQHSAFLYLADIAVRKSVDIEDLYVQHGRPMDYNFSSQVVIQQFSNYFFPVVTNLVDYMMTTKHPRHINYQLDQHALFFTTPSPFKDEQTLLQPLGNRMDEILSKFRNYFPRNHSRDHGHINPLGANPIPDDLIDTRPQFLPITTFFTRQHFHQVMALSIIGVGSMPEITEDFLGFSMAVLVAKPKVFFTSTTATKVVSLCISALYSPVNTIVELAARLLARILDHFVYSSSVRSTYTSGKCNSIQEVEELINNPQNHGGICSSGPRAKYIQTVYPIHWRYLNYIDFYKLNPEAYKFYLSLCLIAPTIVIHALLANLSPLRPSRDLHRTVYPLSTLIHSGVQFIFQNIEPMDQEDYDEDYNGVEIGKMAQRVFIEYETIATQSQHQQKLLTPQQQQSGSIDDQNFMAQVPLDLHSFDPQITAQLQKGFSSIDLPVMPVLLKLLCVAMTFGLTPQYTMQPLLFTQLYQQQLTNNANSNNNNSNSIDPSATILAQPKNYQTPPNYHDVIKLTRSILRAAPSQTQDFVGPIADSIREIIDTIGGDKP